MVKRKRILPIVVLLLVALIWGNSFVPHAASVRESEVVLSWLQPLLRLFTRQDAVSVDMLRKTAHAAEFAALGLALGALLAPRKRWYLLSFGFGAAVAAADEAIQLLSDRHADFADVCLDLCGLLLGTLLCALILTLRRRTRKE